MTDTTPKFDPIPRLQQIAATIRESGADIFDAPNTAVHYINCAIKEIERLRAGGCARDQKTTQYCAEAVALQELIEQLRRERDELCEALREISQMKDEPYSAEFAADTLHHVRLVRKA